MKFQLISFVASLAIIQVIALPQDGTTSAAAPIQTCVLHCGGPYGLECPKGYRCCGPLVAGVGGHCVPGATGICSL